MISNTYQTVLFHQAIFIETITCKRQPEPQKEMFYDNNQLQSTKPYQFVSPLSLIWVDSDCWTRLELDTTTNIIQIGVNGNVEYLQYTALIAQTHTFPYTFRVIFDRIGYPRPNFNLKLLPKLCSFTDLKNELSYDQTV